MIIRMPEHIPKPTVYAFCGLLFVAQIIEGTTPYVALMCLLFILLSVTAFNIAGGMVYPSGAYVGACAALTCILGMVAKVFLNEPMQRNLRTPDRTITVYVVGMAAMLAAAYVNRKLRPKRALLDGMVVRGNASAIAFASIIIGIFAPLVLPSSIVSTFNQANYFLYMAILLPVFTTVRSSHGERSFSWAAFIAWAYSTAFGVFTFSKEAMFGASAAWCIAAVAAGYRVTVRQGAVLALAGLYAVLILSPYSQVGRNYGRNLPAGVAFSIAVDLLGHPLDLRKTYAEQASDELGGETSYHLFDKQEGLFDRLNMISVDDGLIQITDRGVTGSPEALWSYFVNLVPRYLNPSKPNLHWGNIYAHSLGMVGDDDESTGISFSPFGDGYHTGQWLGVSVYAFCIFLFGFFMMDSVGGNAKYSVWALLYVLFMLHQAPEAMLLGPVYGGGTYSVFVIGVAVVCSKLVPAVTNLFFSSNDAPGERLPSGDRQAQSA